MSVAHTRADQRLQDATAAAIAARDMELGTFDVDSFADFLFGDCDGCSPVQLREQMHDVTADDFKGEPTSEVFAIACDAGQPMRTRIAALDSLIDANVAFRLLQAEQMRQRAEALAVVQAFTRKVAA